MECIKDFLNYRSICPFCNKKIDYTKARIQRSYNLRSSICDISINNKTLLIDYLVSAYCFTAYLSLNDNTLTHDFKYKEEISSGAFSNIGYFSLSLVCDCINESNKSRSDKQYRINSNEVYINIKDEIYTDCIVESESINLYYDDGVSLSIKSCYASGITTIYLVPSIYSYNPEDKLPEPIQLNYNLDINEISELSKDKLRKKIERYRVLV